LKTENSRPISPKGFNLPMRINLLAWQPDIRFVHKAQDILTSSHNFVECRWAARELAARGSKETLSQLRNFVNRASAAEKKLWQEIEGCDRRLAGKAFKLSSQRWLVLAAYLSARAAIEKIEPGENSARLFEEFSRVADELQKCEILSNFIIRYAKELETGRYDRRVDIPQTLDLGWCVSPYGQARVAKEREDALRALLTEYLRPYCSPERNNVPREVSNNRVFVAEIKTAAVGIWGWGSFKLFTDLVVDYFGPPIADEGEAIPVRCKRLEWVDELARFESQPLFFRKLPDGVEHYAVIRPHDRGRWGYADKWMNEVNKLELFKGLLKDRLFERKGSVQTMVFYHVPAIQDQIEPVSTGLAGILKDKFGMPVEAIRAIASVSVDRKKKIK